MRFCAVAGREQINLVFFPPNVGSMFCNQRFDMGDGVGIKEDFAGFTLIKNWNRDTPGPLPGNTPIAPFGDHRLNPVSARCRQPLHAINGG